MCTELIICLLGAIVLVLFLMLLDKNKDKEGYSSVANEADNYYLWRTYSSNPYDYKALTSFPHTYHPYEHPQRTNCYNPHDIYYGRGTW